MSRRRKQRQSLDGFRWRKVGPLERGIIMKCSYAELTDEKQKAFLKSIVGKPSISVRQKWYLAFIASRIKKIVYMGEEFEFDEMETEWINDVLSQDCPKEDSGMNGRNKVYFFPENLVPIEANLTGSWYPIATNAVLPVMSQVVPLGDQLEFQPIPAPKPDPTKEFNKQIDQQLAADRARAMLTSGKRKIRK